MAFYERDGVRIRYEDTGTGFPLLIIPGGGLNSSVSTMATNSPFNPVEELKADFRCIVADLRNAGPGQSTGPLDIDRPWDSHTEDQLGLMDHLGIGKFMVLGFCIGGPFTWNLIRMAPGRVVAAVLAQPVGHRPELPEVHVEFSTKNWVPPLRERRPDITPEMIEAYLTRMWRNNPDYMITVSRDFARQCQTPLLVLPDNIPSHPLAPALETVVLAPNAECSMYPWKQPKERIPLAVAHVRSFLRGHRPA